MHFEEASMTPSWWGRIALHFRWRKFDSGFPHVGKDLWRVIAMHFEVKTGQAVK